MSKKIFTATILSAIALILISTTHTYAFEGNGFNREEGMHRGGEFKSMSGNMRGGYDGEYRNMTLEERDALREERIATREERQQEMEAFTGIPHEEMRALHMNGEGIADVLTEKGVTEKEAEEFLTKQANERVDNIVEHRDLDSYEEKTLRDRIGEFVQRILDRWF